MPGGKEREPPKRLPDQREPNHNRQNNSQHAEGVSAPATEQEAFSAAFWSELSKRASVVPMGEDPAFQPVFMLVDFRDYIQHLDQIPNQKKRAFMEKLAPEYETIRKVETAYKIIIYPRVQKPNLRELIALHLEGDRQFHGRDQVELTDRELAIVRDLCEQPRYALTIDPASRSKEPVPVLQPKIPFDPHKRVYRYAEVPVPDDINPYSRRHMTTEEIRKEIAKAHPKRRK